MEKSNEKKKDKHKDGKHKKEKSKKSSKKEAAEEHVTSSKNNLLIGDYSELASPEQQISPVHSSGSKQQLQTNSLTNINAVVNENNNSNVRLFTFNFI